MNTPRAYRQFFLEAQLTAFEAAAQVVCVMQLLTFVTWEAATRRRVILQPKLGGRVVSVFMITFLRAAESEAQAR